MKSHLLEHKSPKRRRRFRKDVSVSEADAPVVKKQLGVK
jgi:ribosomal protein L35